SMENNIKLSKKLGKLKVPEDLLVSRKRIDKYDKNDLVIIATGAQGEEMAALSRLANGDYENFQLEKEDTVIFASGVIPGNEKVVGELVDRLYKKEVNVVRGGDIHTTGHGYRDEIKFMISLIEPKFLM